MASSELTVDTTGTDLPERPKSPWTPSYSVTRQGSQIFNEVKDQLGESEQLPQGVESSTDPNVPLIEESAPAGPSAEAFPVSGHSDEIDRDSVGNTLTVSKDRKRLESTTSSLFFPGGWFSKTPAGRTSLDNAQGEISSPKVMSPIEGRPSVDLLGGSSAPSSAPADAADEGTDDDKEKKGKWCLIM
ncbi:hypothetical protein F5890DRAFT_108351 [Lentinula detonsa]|uniref:Uncharacterized protein n=1 Tax=Lentinula detonsa TaxID=2804962 RepID=A0AA38PXU5_9AGAR|nr:hypothetical protein F5890DRAFT_108351 [Lentinula detonsa]